MAFKASALAMWVLPTPQRPSSTTFSARSMKASPPSTTICLRAGAAGEGKVVPFHGFIAWKLRVDGHTDNIGRDA